MKATPEGSAIGEEIGVLRRSMDVVSRDLDHSGLAPSERVALIRLHKQQQTKLRELQSKLRAVYGPQLVKGRIAR